MLFRPLKIFSLYIIITLLISFFGPSNYVNYNKIIVAIYIFFFLMLFGLGYFLGISKIENKKKKFVNFFHHEKLIQFTKFIILFALILQVIDIFFRVMNTGFSFSSIGESYLDTYSNFERNEGNSYSFIELLRFGKGIIDFFAVTLGVYYFRELGYRWRMLVIIIVILIVFSSLVLVGKQKQLGDVLIIISSVILIKFKSYKFLNIKKISALLLLIFIASFLFIFMQKSRYDAIGINALNYNSLSQSQVALNLDHFIFDFFGFDWGFPISMLLSGYMSGGYYGLSLSLQLPFVWTYGLGSSYVGAVLGERVLNLPYFFEEGYAFRMEEAFGWPALSKWHTIFPWLASDFTFPGALIVMAVIAYIYAVSWIEAKKYANPLSVLMFCLINIMLVFVPANNQIFMGIEQFFLALIFIPIWLNRHRIFKYKCNV